MGMGIPIITNSGIGDSDKILTESKAGILVKEFTEKEYIRVVDQIDDLLNFDRNYSINSAHKYFSLERGAELFDQVYKNLEVE